jgi:hypothetical protein
MHVFHVQNGSYDLKKTLLIPINIIYSMHLLLSMYLAEIRNGLDQVWIRTNGSLTATKILIRRARYKLIQEAHICLTNFGCNNQRNAKHLLPSAAFMAACFLYAPVNLKNSLEWLHGADSTNSRPQDKSLRCVMLGFLSS